MYKDSIINNPDMKYKDMVHKLSQASGIGRRTVINTISKYKREGTDSSPKKNVYVRRSTTKWMI